MQCWILIDARSCQLLLSVLDQEADDMYISYRYVIVAYKVRVLCPQTADTVGS